MARAQGSRLDSMTLGEGKENKNCIISLIAVTSIGGALFLWIEDVQSMVGTLLSQMHMFISEGMRSHFIERIVLHGTAYTMGL